MFLAAWEFSTLLVSGHERSVRVAKTYIGTWNDRTISKQPHLSIYSCIEANYTTWMRSMYTPNVQEARLQNFWKNPNREGLTYFTPCHWKSVTWQDLLYSMNKGTFEPDSEWKLKNGIACNMFEARYFARGNFS